MRKLAVLIPSLLLVLVALPLGAQEVTCDDVAFDERIMTTYPMAREACLEIIENDGVRYAHFKALVHREGFPSMLLRFKHRDDAWGPATLVTIPAGYRVYLEGQPVEAKDVPRGRELSFYMPEGRWQVAMADADELVVEEAAFAPIEFEVTEIELPEEVDMEAPPPPMMTHAEADEAPAEAASADVMQEAEEEATPADDGDPSEWFWILGLAFAFIIVWFLLRRRKARRTG
jgi:hypothetical protein